MQTTSAVAVMNKLDSTVALNLGRESICLHLTSLTFSSISLDVSDEQLRFFINQ
jgi:hypothetical protein